MAGTEILSTCCGTASTRRADRRRPRSQVRAATAPRSLGRWDPGYPCLRISTEVDIIWTAGDSSLPCRIVGVGMAQAAVMGRTARENLRSS